MSRLFAYCRISPADQTTENQVKEIETAGFTVAKQRNIAETVSGSVVASECKGFSKLLLGRLELNWLGRNAIDVRATVEAWQLPVCAFN